MRKRIEWIDVAKCFGIFAIYLGHCTGDAGKAYEFVYTHHVPLFFVLAGFTEALGSEKSFGKYVIKLLKGLIIPWLMFAVISIVFCNVLLYDNSLQSVAENIVLVAKGTIKEQFMASSLWFITCLAVIKIVFFWIKKIKNKLLILLVSLGLHFVTVLVFPEIPINIPSLPYNIDSALYYLVYFAVGYCTYSMVEKMLTVKTRKIQIFVAVMTLFSAYFSVRLYFGWDILNFASNNVIIAPLYKVARPLIMIWMYIVAAYICHDIVIFNDIGRNTLYLCGSEYLIRVLVEEIGKMIGVSITLHNPLSAVIYTLLILWIGNKYIVPMEKTLLNKLEWIKE